MVEKKIKLMLYSILVENVAEVGVQLGKHFFGMPYYSVIFSPWLCFISTDEI